MSQEKVNLPVSPDMQKTISILVPCYNEEETVVPLSDAIRKTFREELPSYRYELIFIDNCSTDHTQEKLAGLCARPGHQSDLQCEKTSGSLILPITACSRRRETVRCCWRRIFRTQWK